jgi:hypothetical protein
MVTVVLVLLEAGRGQHTDAGLPASIGLVPGDDDRLAGVVGV